jgi:hypothetical protein
VLGARMSCRVTSCVGVSACSPITSWITQDPSACQTVGASLVNPSTCRGSRDFQWCVEVSAASAFTHFRPARQTPGYVSEDQAEEPSPHSSVVVRLVCCGGPDSSVWAGGIAVARPVNPPAQGVRLEGDVRCEAL